MPRSRSGSARRRLNRGGRLAWSKLTARPTWFNEHVVDPAREIASAMGVADLGEGSTGGASDGNLVAANKSGPDKGRIPGKHLAGVAHTQTFGRSFDVAVPPPPDSEGPKPTFGQLFDIIDRERGEDDAEQPGQHRATGVTEIAVDAMRGAEHDEMPRSSA